MDYNPLLILEDKQYCNNLLDGNNPHSAPLSFKILVTNDNYPYYYNI